MKKRVFYTELSYLLGMVILAFAAAMMTRADFGLSMVVAPAYLLHLKVSELLPFFSFGMAEYTLQAVLLIVLCLAVRRFRLCYLFSFVTAVLYGFVLDGSLWLRSFIPMDSIALRFAFYVVGMVLCALGVSLFFHTYISPEVYELFVKEVSGKFKVDIHKVKTVYDCISCLAAVVMSFAFFGMWQFEGVNWGTIVCALVNGWLIGQVTKLLEKHFDFRDAMKWKPYFE